MSSKKVRCIHGVMGVAPGFGGPRTGKVYSVLKEDDLRYNIEVHNGEGWGKDRFEVISIGCPCKVSNCIAKHK